MSFGQVLRNTFQKFIGIAPHRPVLSSFLTPSTLNSWSVDFVRTKTRHHFPRPNEAKRIKRHGWWTRMATREGRRILQRRILKGRYVLMKTKYFGCRPISLIRSFSDTVEPGKIKQKLKRNTNYYAPILSEERKQSIKKIVSLQMYGRYLTCTTILRDGNVLDDWKLLSMPEDMNKFNLDDIYNSVVLLMENLPEGDIYLIENYMKMQKNMNVVGANLFYVKLQTIAMLIALINSSKTFNSSDTMQRPMNKVILMKARLHARLFRIIIGTEIISSQEITELMLKGTFPEHMTPIVPAIDAVLSYRSIKEPIVKELMSNGLMMAMTFVDLVLNVNLKSIQAISGNSKRRLKTTKNE